MFKNHNAKKVFVYGLAGLLGLVCVLWLALEDVGSAAIEEPRNHRDDPLQAISVSGEVLTKPGVGLSKQLLDQAPQLVNHSVNVGSRQCSVGCESTFSMLDEHLELDDETYQRLEAHIQEIAAHLQHDDALRQHYIQMALTTLDGDKRAFLSAIFNHLPFRQKIEIGGDFIGSDNWRVRADGVTLIADQADPNFGLANTLMDVFTNEQNSYVKHNILNHLKQNSVLKGDAKILNQLDSAIYNQADTSVRVAALRAKMQLSERVHHILPDALQALRTNDPEFQLAGLIAIEQILEYNKKFGEHDAYIDKNSIKYEFQIIGDLTHHNGDKKRFDRLIREANRIYSRYFDY